MATPKKGVAYDFRVTLNDSESNRRFKTVPTIEAGDFQVSVDDATPVNLATLPVVSPSGSKQVKVSLSAAEMDGDKVTVIGSDSDEEWDDIFVEIDVPQYNELDFQRALRTSDRIFTWPPI